MSTLYVQGGPTGNGFFEFNILGTYNVATIDFDTSNFSKHADIWYSVSNLSYCSIIGRGEWILCYSKMTINFRHFENSSPFFYILLFELVQTFKFWVKPCLRIKNSIKHGILKSDVPNLKMKEFGKIDTFMILVAYCLKKLTFSFQIIKCPHLWKNLRY